MYNPSRSEESPTETHFKSRSDDDDDDDDSDSDDSDSDDSDDHHPSFWTFSTLNAPISYQKMSKYILKPSWIFAILNAAVSGPIITIIPKSARFGLSISDFKCNGKWSIIVDNPIDIVRWISWI